MFKKATSYLVLVSLIFALTPLIVRAESSNFSQTNFDLPSDTDFSLVINGQDLHDVYSIEFTLEYNPQIINYQDITTGIFTDPNGFVFFPPFAMPISETAESLVVSIPCDILQNGNGELATLYFHTGQNDGSTDIIMTNMSIYYTNDPFVPANGIVASPATITVTAPDITAPVRSSANPVGALSYDTTEINISVVTDENAVCHYSNVADTLFADSLEMTSTGNTQHSVLINGLTPGNSYNYYVRCSDTAGNINEDDYIISFSVDSEPVDGGSEDNGSTSPAPLVSNTHLANNFIIILQENKNNGKQKQEEVKVLGFSKYADGSLLRGSNLQIYVIRGIYKQRIHNLIELAHYADESIFNVDDATLGEYPTLRYGEGDLVREQGDERVFQIVGSNLKKVINLEELRANFAGQRIYNISHREIQALGL